MRLNKPLNLLSLSITVLLLGACAKPVTDPLQISAPPGKFSDWGEVTFDPETGLDRDALKKAMQYSCEAPVAPQTPMEDADNTEQSWKQCESKFPEKLSQEIALNWHCPQTDRVKLKRPLPASAVIKLPVQISKNGKLPQFQVDVKPIQNFLNAALDGNTAYSTCVTGLQNEVIDAVNRMMKQASGGTCGQFNHKSSPGRSVIEAIGEIQTKFFAREEKVTLLQPIIPFFESIEGIAPTVIGRCDSLRFGSSRWDWATPQVTRDENILNALSKDFISKHFSGRPLRGTSCDFALLGSVEPAKLLSYLCARDFKSENCAIQLKQMRAMYLAMDPKLGDSFAQIVDAAKMQGEFAKWKLAIKSSNPEICEKIKTGSKFELANNMGLRGGHNTQYRLSRPSDHEFVVEVNMVFKPDCSSSEFENKKVADLWYKKVQSCLSAAAPHMKTTDGEQVTIKVTSESEFGGLKAHSVAVTGNEEKIRENSQLYSLNTDCGTIIHEVLHLTGLVDEYEETDKSMDYSCRKLGPESSIMRNTYMSIAKARFEGQSLLMPAHSRFLIYPNCQAKNKVYSDCSSVAYVSKNSCSTQSFPPECQNNSLDWITR